MKTHLAWFRIVMAVVMASALGERQAAAQYGPYNPAPQAANGYGYGYPAGVQPGPAYQQPAPPQGMAPAAQTPYTANRPQPQQQFQPQPQQYAQQPGVPNQYPAYQPQTVPMQGYPAYSVAAQPNQVMPTPAQGESLPTPAGATSPVNGATTMPQGATTMDPHQGHAHGYPNTGYSSADSSAYGNGAACGYQDYGLGAYMNEPCSDTQWFGGIYFLYMERDNPGRTKLAVQADPPTDPYYPPASTTILSTADVDHEYREGVEVRFGSTFSVGNSCDTGCNNPYGYGGYGASCGPRCPPDLYAWEVAFWGIDRDIDWLTVVDIVPGDTYRMYGMVNHAGLEYDRDGDGTYDNSVNAYYDYQMPIAQDGPPVAGDLRVLAQRVRTNFSAKNLELNLLKFPVCGVSSCSAGPSGCDAYGGYGAAGNCAPAACQDDCGSAFSMAALCGVRYFRCDDDFELATEFSTYDGASFDEPWNGFDYESDNELFHDIQLENHLVGFQLGANLNYCIACKWNFFADSNFGLYNNHVSKYERIYNPLGGDVRFIQEQRNASADSDKNDVAFLGEVRLGGSYDISCNWRAVLAYRALAISGVALSTEQIRSEYSNWADMARIDSNSSVIIHGVQAGVECRY